MRTTVGNIDRRQSEDRTMDRLNRDALFSALRVSGTFTLLGVFWILASDRILLKIVSDAGTITTWQTYKGWAFVLIIALLIYWLLFCELRRRMQAENSLGIALEAARLGCWDLDLVENYTHRSLRHDQIFGYQILQSEWNYEIFLKHVLPEDRVRVAECFSRALTHGELNLDCRIRWADMTVHWVEVRGRAYFSADGRPIRMVGLVIDATERKREEEALRASEESFRAIFESHHAVMLIVDPESGRIVDGSPGACSFYGCSRKELKKKRITEIDTLSSEQVFDRMQMAKDQQCRYFDCQHRLAGGEVRDVDVCTGPIVVSGRTLLFALVNDVTDRKKAEHALRESDERMRLLIESSPVGIGIVQDGEYVYANPALVGMIGCAGPEEIVGQSPLAFIVPEDRDIVRQRDKQRLEGLDPAKNYQVRGLRRNGESFEVIIWPTKIDYSGKPSILSFVADVTQENKLKAQLLQAQKMETVGTLAGGIAHDFNNLLTIVMGYSELLLTEKGEAQPDHADLQRIFHAAKNGAELVQRLLMFSRKSQPKPVPMNLNEQVLQVEELLRRTIPRMIDIYLDLAADIPGINADPSQMEQVLMNLAVNARDAMADVGKLIVRTSHVTLDQEYCRLHVEADPGEYVLLEISDTGHWMDKETVKHIFEPFFTTKEIGRGTGLGLAMVYGIVKQHNGHVTVYSEVGKGTTFRVYLPAMESPAEPDVKDSGGMIPAMGTETVLLVDDEESVRELGARILAKQGYNVLKVGNGR